MPILPPDQTDQFMRDPAMLRRMQMEQQQQESAAAPPPPGEGMPTGGDRKPAEPSRRRVVADDTDAPLREPKVLPRVRDDTARWIGRTNQDTARQKRIKLRSVKISELLSPHRLLQSADLPDNMQIDSDQRTVRIPLIYRYMHQACAQTLKGILGAEWKPAELVKPPPGAMNKGYEHAKRFGKSLEIVVQELLDEQHWDRVMYRMLQHAWCYSMPVLKVVWENRTEDHPASRGGVQATGDLRAMRDKLAQYYRQARKGELTPASADWAAMVTLRDTIQQQGKEQLPVLKYGIRLSVIRPGSFICDPSVTDWLDFYNADWMGDEYYVTRAEARALFPFRYLDPAGAEPEDVEQGFLPFEGIFPDHLPSLSPAGGYASPRSPASMAVITPAVSPDTHNVNNENARQAMPDEPKIWVREVWIRSLGVVRTYVAGIDYPVREVRYANLTKDFYPYHMLSLFDLPGELEQSAPVEMSGPIQSRINWKSSDGEVARNLSMPRGVYAKDQLDPDDVNKLEGQAAGTWEGIKFPANTDDLRKIFMQFSWQMDGAVFDTTVDELNLAQTLGISQASTGKVGNSRFAAEVHEQARGEAATGNWIQGRCAEFDAQVRTAVAELALQNLTQVQARQIAGEFVFWPQVLTMAEAETMVAQIRKAAWDRTLQELLPTFGEALFQDAGGPDMEQELETTGQAIYQQYLMEGLLEKFGLDEPLTRESLFRRLRAKPRSYVDKQAYMDQKVILLKLLYEMIAANPSANLTPLLQQIAAMLGEPDALDEVLLPDVNRAVLQIQDAMARGMQIPPEAIQALVALVQQLLGPPQGKPAQAPPEEQPQTAGQVQEAEAGGEEAEGQAPVGGPQTPGGTQPGPAAGQ